LHAQLVLSTYSMTEKLVSYKPTQGIIRLWLLKEIMMRYRYTDYMTMRLPYAIHT